MGKAQDLTALERDQIAKLLAQGLSKRKIAKQLGRSKTAICDEIKRNGFWEKGTGKFEYSPSVATHRAKKKRRLASSSNPRHDHQAVSYVLSRIRLGWSPEIIYGRAKLEYPNDARYWMCTESIYQLIYSEKYKQECLWETLPRRQKKRRKKSGRKVHKSRIPQRVSIHQRPDIVSERKVFGHWEGDTVEGKGHRDGVHTEVERVSRFLRARRVERIASEETIAQQKEIFKSLPKKARVSTTLDNGRENHLHMQLHSLGIMTYFADPYSSWQRGTNEWHNGLFRRYFPKGTDFKQVSQQEIDEVVTEINDRPRKVLKFRTPLEIFNSYLSVRNCS